MKLKPDFRELRIRQLLTNKALEKLKKWICTAWFCIPIIHCFWF